MKIPGSPCYPGGNNVLLYMEKCVNLYLSSYQGEIFGACAGVGGPRHSRNWPDTRMVHQRHLSKRKRQTSMINKEDTRWLNGRMEQYKSVYFIGGGKHK